MKRVSEHIPTRRTKPAITNANTVDVEAMELDVFVTAFRHKAQKQLWEHAEKITVGDLVKLADLEQETRKRSESARAKELRVVWVNEKKAA
jgi:uncharacterized Zn finger protein